MKSIKSCVCGHLMASHVRATPPINEAFCMGMGCECLGFVSKVKEKVFRLSRTRYGQMAQLTKDLNGRASGNNYYVLGVEKSGSKYLYDKVFLASSTGSFWVTSRVYKEYFRTLGKHLSAFAMNTFKEFKAIHKFSIREKDELVTKAQNVEPTPKYMKGALAELHFREALTSYFDGLEGMGGTFVCLLQKGGIKQILVGGDKDTARAMLLEAAVSMAGQQRAFMTVTLPTTIKELREKKL